MAKARFTGAGLRWPKFTMSPAFLRTAPSLQNTAIGAASAARMSILGHVEWADGGSHDISIVHFRVGSSSLVGTLRVSLRDPSTVAGPPGRDDGTIDQSATQATPAGATNYSLTLDANRTVAQGGFLALVFDYSAWTSGSTSLHTLATGTTSDWMHRPVVTIFDGTATYTVQGLMPSITFEAADGTFGQFAETFPRISAAINAPAFNSGSTPDEYALEFTVPGPVWCSGFGVLLQAAASADFDLVLYEGTTALQTVSFVTDTIGADAAVRWAQAKFADIALTPGNTYRLALKPTTANNVTWYSFDVSVAGHLAAMLGSAGYTTRTDAGSWAAITATRFPIGYLEFNAIDDGASAGGGVLLHPGMAGGVNG